MFKLGLLHGLSVRPALNLQAKLTLFGAALVLSAVGATSLVAWQLLDQLAESAARTRLDHAAEVVLAEYDNLLGNGRITAEAIAAWPVQERPGVFAPLDVLPTVLRRSPFVQTAFRTRAVDLIALVGPDGTPRLVLQRGQESTTPPASASTLAQALAGNLVEGLELVDGDLRAVTAEPLLVGEDVVAVVVVASLLDNSLADRLKAATAFDVTFYADGRAAATSARLPDGSRSLDGRVAPDVAASVVREGQVVERVHRGPAGHRVISRYYPLRGVTGEPVGLFSISAPVALLFEARTQVFAVFGLVVVGVLVIALALSAYFAQALSHPLRALVRAVRQIGEGDLTTAIECSGTDEVGLLARALEDMRRQLQRHAEEHAQLDQLKDQYLFNVAHELKTPLASLAATVELLTDADASLPPAERTYLLGVLRRSTTRLQTLVDNLLDLGSLRAGRFTISVHPVALDRVAADAIASVQPLLDARGQRVACSFGDPPPLVQADPRRLQQVLVNLLANAAKFGTDNDTIRIEATRQDSQVRVAVIDHGPGIPAAEQAHLFEAYFRSAVARELTPGVGLGLAIVKAIVEAHGGQVGIESAPGRGTTAWFTLPSAEPVLASAAASPPTAAAAVPRGDTTP